MSDSKASIKTLPRVDQELQTAVNVPVPPDRMKFGSVAPRLKQRGFQFSHSAVVDALPVALTLVGLVLALVSAIKIGTTPIIPQNELKTGAFPALACFCLMFVSLEQLDMKIKSQ